MNYGGRLGAVKTLTPKDNGIGYFQVKLSNPCKMLLVHRLVAEAFVPRVAGKNFVNHRDENRANNKADNLEWCTVKENINYGTGPAKRRAAIRAAIRAVRRKPVRQFDLSGKAVAVFPSVAEAATKTGICSSGIGCCANGRRKSAGGYIWKFANKQENERIKNQ